MACDANETYENIKKEIDLLMAVVHIFIGRPDFYAIALLVHIN